MSPWGWTTDLPPDADFAEMSACMLAAKEAVLATNGLSFKIGSSGRAIYVASGGADDWWYSEHGVKYAYTIEVRGDSFQPNPSNIIPSNEEIFAGMMAQVECAYTRAFGGDGVPAQAVNCLDRKVTNIAFSSGKAATCNELGDYCFTEKIVRERCPETCQQCGPTYVGSPDTAKATITSDPLDSKNSLSEFVPVLVPLAAGLAIGVAATCFFLRPVEMMKKVPHYNLKTTSTFGDTDEQQLGMKTVNPIHEPKGKMFDI
mmetsp:Transcript_1941/g.2579  ORF Transcript_1941/g.2579 Transcript_1941/m.2579 type:complete len:259 (+) Transcript_1941:3-779(+)